jgi:hypothetical protein
MIARLAIALGFILALFPAWPGLADDVQPGDLDFARLTKPQEQFFWKRVKSLAFEEAALAYCGQPDDFESRVKQGVRSCVTAEAMNKAESVFKSELKASEAGFTARKTACAAKPAATRGWLGVDLRPLGGDIVGSVGARVTPGAVVVAAFDNSPAAAADVEAGDVITSVNGESVADPKELSAKIRALAPGATVQLGLLRNGAGRTVGVKLGAMGFDRQGKIALDMPDLIQSSRQDLKYVSDQVTEMCRKCKTTIWAMFCH